MMDGRSAKLAHSRTLQAAADTPWAKSIRWTNTLKGGGRHKTFFGAQSVATLVGAMTSPFARNVKEKGAVLGRRQARVHKFKPFTIRLVEDSVVDGSTFKIDHGKRNGNHYCSQGR